MYTLTNPDSGADIEAPWLTLKAGESIVVSEVVAKDAVTRWGFLKMEETSIEMEAAEEAVKKEAVKVEEVVKKVVKKATKKEVVKKVLKKVTKKK